MIDELKPEGIERLRTGPKPQRERFDFAYTMNRWAQLASDTSTVVRVNLFPSEWPTDDGADVVAELPATPSEKGARASVAVAPLIENGMPRRPRQQPSRWPRGV